VVNFTQVSVAGKETAIFQALRNADFPTIRDPSQRRRPIHSFVDGSRVELLVEAKGLEPSTP
jgi:hypothetical protein